jgi:hypothetical protein
LYKSNKFAAVVNVFPLAAKFTTSFIGACDGPNFALCVPAKITLPIVGN